MNILAGVAQNHPQSAYAGLQKSLQKEWAFVQRVTPGVGDAFFPVEVELKEIFVPALFQGLREGVTERGITRLPAKQAGMAIPNPDFSAWENWVASCFVTGNLIEVLHRQTYFKTGYYAVLL